MPQCLFKFRNIMFILEINSEMPGDSINAFLHWLDEGDKSRLQVWLS